MNRPGNAGALGFGVIGAGNWGEAHAHVYATHHRSKLVAVCDVVADRAERLAAKYGVRAYTDVDAMLDEPDLRAVGIATPDFAHRLPAVAAANAGKHILIEKPLATTLDDVTAIEEAVRRNGVRLMVDFHARWNPALSVVKSSIDRGDLGQLVSAYYRLNDTISVPLEMLSWAKQSSVLWFLGSHAIDTLRWLLDDEVASVYVQSRSGVLAAAGLDVPDVYQSILTFRSGTIATIENAWILPNTHPSVNDIKLNVLGSVGMVDVDLSNHKVVQRFLRDRYDHPDVFVMPEVNGKNSGFAYEAIRDFVDRLADGRPFVTDISDGVEGTKIILAMLASANKGVSTTL